MNPAETAAFLRQFNEWRRGDYEPSEQPAPPDPREIGEAIDTAVEMVERMEGDLRLIAETDPIDAALDPQRAIRIARTALEETK